MHRSRAIKLATVDKFGYSLETYRLSALASLETNACHKENYPKVRQTNERLFGDFNAFADSKLRNPLERLSSHFCFDRDPNCSQCPVSKICDNSGVKPTTQWRTRSKIRALSFVDMFCGAGGMSAGLVEAGYVPLLAIDNDDASIKTYEYNHRQFEKISALHQDITLLAKQNFDTISKLCPDLIVGGPPCQGFSNANRQRLSDDPRNLLYRTFLTSLKFSGATYAILENVVGMAKAAPSIKKEFEDIGYVVDFLILNAQDFGVPQNRKRLFIIAKKSSHVSEDQKFFNRLKVAIEERKVVSKVGIRDVIADLPSLAAKTLPNTTAIESQNFGFTCWIADEGESYSVIFNHRSKYLNERDLLIYSLLKPGEDSTALAIQELNPYRNRDHIFKDKFFRLHPDKPSKTITAHMYYDTHMYIHPLQSRGLTPREAARIQGFKDDFVFFGYPNEWYRQIGNAVSPVVSQVLGEAIEYAGSRVS